MSLYSNQQIAATEILRKDHRPEKVSVLLVGEAPPANGTFFYKCDSNLYQYTKKAFEDAFELKFKSCREFLDFFRSHGFYLDDLVLEPISKGNRARQREAGVNSLAARIKRYDPARIIIVMKGVQVHVLQATSHAAVKPKCICALDFPAQSHHLDYMRELSTILRELITKGEF